MSLILYNNISTIILTWFCGIIGCIANGYILLKQHMHKHNRVDSNRIANINFNHGSSNHSATSPRRYYRNYKTNHCFNILTFNLAISDLCGCIYLLILAFADLHYRNKPIPNETSYSSGHYPNQANVHNTYHHSSTNLTTQPNEWITSVACYVARIFYISATIQSVNIVLLIAIERFICIHYPGQFHNMITVRKTKLAIGFGWLIVSFMSILMIIFVHHTLDSDSHIFSYRYHSLCIFDNIEKSFIRILLVVEYTLCMLIYGIIISLYVSILLKLKRIRQNGSIMFNAAKGEKSILVVAIATGATNLLCWFPSTFAAFGLMIWWPTIQTEHQIFINFVPILILLFPVNCSLNPILNIFITSKLGRKLIHGKSNYATT